MVETFRKAFLIHGQGVHLNIFNPLFHFLQKVLFHPVFHIAEHNICLGAFPGVHHLHTKVGASDPSPDQRSVKHHRLYKTVLTAAQRLILVRLRNASGGIGSGVQQHTSVIAVYEKGKHAGQNIVDDIIPFILEIHLHIGRRFLCHLIGALRHVLRRQADEILQDLHHQLVLAESVNKINAGLPAAHLNYPVDHVKAGIRRHMRPHIFHAFLQGYGHFLTALPLFLYAFLYAGILLQNKNSFHDLPLFLIVCLGRGFLMHSKKTVSYSSLCKILLISSTISLITPACFVTSAVSPALPSAMLLME